MNRWISNALCLGSLFAQACSTPQPVHSPTVSRPIPLSEQTVRQTRGETPLGEAPSSSLIWRKVAPSARDARATVRRFFDVIARESNAQLQELLADDALFHRPNQPPTPALLAWGRRFSVGDYSQSVTTQPVQLLDHDAARRLGAHRAVHLLPERGELVALVKLNSPQPAVPALWGTEVQLLLRFDDAQWKIRAVWEDYPGK